MFNLIETYNIINLILIRKHTILIDVRIITRSVVLYKDNLDGTRQFNNRLDRKLIYRLINIEYHVAELNNMIKSIS